MTSWPTTAAEAIAVQQELRGLVDPTDTAGPPRYVAGLDVAYDGDRLAAAVVVLDWETLEEVDRSVVLGVLTGIPSIGAAKTTFVGSHDDLARERGATADLVDNGEVVGAALRTQDGVKPVYVSVGHRVSLATAVDQVLHLAPRYRLPETTRAADHLCREGLRDG